MLIDKTDTSHSNDPADVAIDHVANNYEHIILKLSLIPEKWIETYPLLGIFDFSITKHVFLLILVAFITVSSMIFLVQNYISSKTKVPGKTMNFIEMIILYMRENVLKSFIGEKYYKDWDALVYTIFFFVLIGNFLGLIPIFDFLGLINYLAGGIPVVKDLIHGGNTVTANINLNFALATITFGAFTIAGIKRYGFFHHWKNLAPPGLAWPLYFIVVQIEVMAMLIRTISLTLRLAGNMVGGHLALIIFTQLFIIEVAKNYGIFAALGGSIFSVSLSIGVIFLEIIVAFIQAYVFALLTAVYIGMAVNVDH